jgi:hypothetical protein
VASGSVLCVTHFQACHEYIYGVHAQLAMRVTNIHIGAHVYLPFVNASTFVVCDL